MRFILAILAFIIATALLAAGIAQRTVFRPPTSSTSSVSMTGSEPYIIIDSSVLTARPGNQTITVSGAGRVFAAYGRTADVHAWVDGSPYRQLSVGGSPSNLVSTAVAANPDGAANVGSGSSNPDGSDLWLEQYVSDSTLVRSLSLPSGYSVIIASDGTAPAPGTVSISWPLDTSTPLAGPLLVAGGIALLAGLVLLLLGLMHLKRQSGPRRKPPGSLPRGKRYSASRHNAIESSTTRGRRAITRSFIVLIPLGLVSTLALSGCSPDYWPHAASDTAPDPSVSALATPTPTASGGAPKDETPPVVATPSQVNSIVASVSAAASAADAAGNAQLLSPRFAGPAYDIRAASYTIKAAYPAFVGQPAIPSGPPSVVLPQATTSWPRTVFTVVQNQSDPNGPSLAMMLVQQAPRSNYKATYVIALEPGTTLPPVASASVGTSRLGPDTKLLTMTPAETKNAYADVMLNGQASASYNLFNVSNDTLLPQVGVDYKNTRKAGLPATATVEYGKVDGPGQNIAMATNASGALATVNVRESEIVKPVQAGATVSPEGAVKALSGVSSSTKGTEADYDYQLLFFIPPKGSSGTQVTLLGFSQGLFSAKELP